MKSRGFAARIGGSAAIASRATIFRQLRRLMGNSEVRARRSWYVSVHENGRRKMNLVARLYTYSTFLINWIDCGAHISVAYPKVERTIAIMFDGYSGSTSAALRRKPRSLLALEHRSLTCFDQVRSFSIKTPKSFSLSATSSSFSLDGIGELDWVLFSLLLFGIYTCPR